MPRQHLVEAREQVPVAVEKRGAVGVRLGGGQELAETFGVPLLASVALDASAICEHAETVVEGVASPVRITGCSVRGALTRAGASTR